MAVIRAFLIVLSAIGAAAPIPARQEYTEVHMGVAVRVVVYAADEPAARAAARAAFDRVATLDGMMSDYRDDSELKQLERRTGEWVQVSAPLITVMTRAVEIARATGGAFDPTVGPLVALWRESRRSGRLPARAALDEARARVGWRRVKIDRGRGAIRLASPGMRLDLGGIAKGYILQEALAALRAHGVTRALLEAGGDIVVGDAPPDRPGWQIDVPGAAAELADRAATLANAAFATSGDAAQFVVIDGVRYSHVIDPRTGLGLTNHVTAHVIAPDGATADALATALTVLGPARWKGVLPAFPGVAAGLHQLH